MALFGYPNCTNPHSQSNNRGCNCGPCTVIRETWGKGFIYNGTLTKDSAQYVSGYVTKKMTNPKNELVKEFLNGRHPEYSRMSLKPGIGAEAMKNLANALNCEEGLADIDIRGDVPDVMAHGKKKYPLGRYLKRKLRDEMGFKEIGTPQEMLSKLRQESIEEHLQNQKETKLPYGDQKTLLIEKNRGKIDSIEKRYKLFNSKRRI